MPSSSKHETCQEQRLINGFKAIYARLYYSNLHKEAHDLTRIFCDLLECTQKELIHSLKSDPEGWNDLATKAKKQTDSDNVWVAADNMADAAACLFEFGRKKEGGEFCEWAEEMRELAIALYEEEQERKQKGQSRARYYGLQGSEVDMDMDMEIKGGTIGLRKRR